MRGAGAGQAGDDDRLADDHLVNLGVPIQRILDQQPVLGEQQQLVAQVQPAQVVELGVASPFITQQRQPFAEVRGSEIIEGQGDAGLVEDFAGVEGDVERLAKRQQGALLVGVLRRTEVGDANGLGHGRPRQLIDRCV